MSIYIGHVPPFKPATAVAQHCRSCGGEIRYMANGGDDGWYLRRQCLGYTESRCDAQPTATHQNIGLVTAGQLRGRGFWVDKESAQRWPNARRRPEPTPF